jgi:hypothetical protein
MLTLVFSSSARNPTHRTHPTPNYPIRHHSPAPSFQQQSDLNPRYAPWENGQLLKPAQSLRHQSPVTSGKPQNQPQPQIQSHFPLNLKGPTQSQQQQQQQSQQQQQRHFAQQHHEQQNTLKLRQEQLKLQEQLKGRFLILVNYCYFFL